jgi:hypothetical protein
MASASHCRAVVASRGRFRDKTLELVDRYFKSLPRAQPKRARAPLALSVELLDFLLASPARPRDAAPVGAADLRKEYLARGAFVLYDQDEVDAAGAFATIVEMLDVTSVVRVQVFEWSGALLVVCNGARRVAARFPGGDTWRLRSDAEAAWVVEHVGVPDKAAAWFVTEEL